MAEPPAVTIVTIGAYGWSEAEFLAALVAAGVDTVVDVRARRGARGAAYAFANSRRLQASLAAAGIRYRHRPDLAPGRGAARPTGPGRQSTAHRQAPAPGPQPRLRGRLRAGAAGELR